MNVENNSNIEALSQGASNHPEQNDVVAPNPPVQENKNIEVPPQTNMPQPEQNQIPVKKEPEQPTHEQLSNDAKSVLETVKLDSATVEKEWFDNGGKLTDDTYSALEKAGISRDIVDNYGKMLQTSQQQSFETQKTNYQSAIDNVTGGREETVKLVDFLNSGAIPSSEYQALYAQLDRGDVKQGEAAIRRLQNLYSEKYGKDGTPVQGLHANTATYGDVFNSSNEVSLAFKDASKGDPRTKDQRQDIVLEKLSRTNEARKARGLPAFYAG